MKRQNNDLIRMTYERIKETIDVRWVSPGKIGRRESATLRPVRAAVHNARTTCKEKEKVIRTVRARETNPESSAGYAQRARRGMAEVTQSFDNIGQPAGPNLICDRQLRPSPDARARNVSRPRTILM